MNYQEVIKHNATLKQICFEHKYRFLKHHDFVNRLLTERGLYEECIPHGSESNYVVTLIVLVEDLVESDLQVTIELWGLQTCPYINCRIIPVGKCNKKELHEWLSDKYITSTLDVSLITGSNPWEGIASDYVLFAKPGDILHPSLATVLSLYQKNNPDIVTFNYQHVSDMGKKPELFCRQAGYERYSIFHVNYIGLSFAVRTSVIKEYPGHLIDEVYHNDGHLFHIWAFDVSELSCVPHPEYLYLKSINNLGNSHLKYINNKERYKKYFAKYQDEYNFISLDCVDQPYRLEPNIDDFSVSIIIPFKDKADMTCTCVDSVLAQSINGGVEVVLINNNSSNESLDIINKYISKNKNKEINIKIINYNHPFNHSRQCNLGIKQSTGDVVVFLNNDAVLKGSEALNILSRWALVDGIGTVGGRVVSKKGAIVSTGLRARLNAGFDYSSGIEESTDALYSKSIKEILGNTFACSAVSRTVLKDVGDLNEREFPNGYNDIDYNLRVSEKGYKNLYVGQVEIIHNPGTSRGRCDEVLQKILIRKRYPELAFKSLYQLGSDDHLLQRYVKLSNNISVHDDKVTSGKYMVRTLLLSIKNKLISK